MTRVNIFLILMFNIILISCGSSGSAESVEVQTSGLFSEEVWDKFEEIEDVYFERDTIFREEVEDLRGELISAESDVEVVSKRVDRLFRLMRKERKNGKKDK